MDVVRRWVRNPQSTWVRKALFQVHLWTGLGIGLYVLVASVTGSILVFRNELNQALTPTKHVAPIGVRLSDDQLRAAAQRRFPAFKVTGILPQRRGDLPVEVRLARANRQVERLFDPYSGTDLGDAVPGDIRAVHWLVDLHDNLLIGQRGRIYNGAGALLVTALTLTGIIVWWPGVANWRRSVMVQRHVGWKRFSWELHSTIGFWLFVLLFMWALSGVYFSFPEPFNNVVDYFEPPAVGMRPGVGEMALVWLARLHFGRFAGTGTKALWAVLGLAPSCLFVTGVVMWWNRVIGPSRRSAEGERGVRRTA